MSVRPFHHQRPLAAVAAAYGVGVWAGVRFSWHPLGALVGLALSVCAALLMLRAGRKSILGIMFAALFAGMLLAGSAAHPALMDAGKYRVQGTLSQDITLREDGSAAGYLENLTLTAEDGEEVCVSRAYWTYTPDEARPFLPREGDRVAFSARLYHPSGQVNPYGFDFRLFLLQKGVPVGLSGAAEPEEEEHPGRGLRSVFYQARQKLDNRLQAVFGEESALPEALLLGIRENLPEDTLERFSDVGVAHLLSVSGLHTALLAGALLLLLRRFFSLKGQTVGLALFLGAYCALLNFAAPVARASLLLLFAQGQRMLRRAPDPLTTLSAAFLILLLLRPLDLFSASFQLSFCAVLGIVALAPPLRRHLERLRPRFLREGIIVTLSATLGALLPTAQIFHRVSLLGILVNPVLGAAFGALLPAYAVILLLGCVYLPLGQFLAVPMSAVTRAFLASVDALGRLPFAAVRLPFLPWYCVMAIAAALALATGYVLIRGWKRPALAVTLLMVSFSCWYLTAPREVQYLQLAMGQADAALILDGRETLLIDAGSYGGDVASYLLSTGRNADHVLLTHLHSDHCLGLRELIRKRVPIGRVYLPWGAEEQEVDAACLELIHTLREDGVPIAFLAAGDTLNLSRTQVSVVWPPAEAVRPGQDANRYSLTALCDLDGVKLLTCADLPGTFEQYAAADADLLKVAHHGSKYSTGEDFLSIVTPEAAILTASPSSASLPHPDTLSRLDRAGVPVYNTGECGAVLVTIREGAAHLTTYLKREEQP